MPESKLIYIASLYSSSLEDDIQNFYEREAREASVECYIHKQYAIGEDKDNMLYSPIVHFHKMAQGYGMPKDVEFWWMINKVMLDKADELRILMMEGWQISKGMSKEIVYFESLFKPILYINWHLDSD